MEFEKVLKERRSIRRFKDKEIEKEKIKKIVDLIKYIPTAHNLQDYELFLTRKPETKKRLAEAALNQTFISEAQIVFVLCADTEKEGTKRGFLYSVQAATMAGYVITLAAHNLGLGTCFIGAFHETEVSRILSLPRNLLPILIIPIECPDEKPSMPPRRKNYFHEI